MAQQDIPDLFKVINDLRADVERLQRSGGGAEMRFVGTTGEPVFQNGWGNYSGGGYRAAAFGRVGPLVVLTGLVADGNPSVAIFTLPEGYRPATGLLFGTTSNTGLTRIDVLASGAVIHVSGGAGFLTLDGIIFVPEL